MGENKLIAIVGLAGSGKTSASQFFLKKGYKYIRFGQIVLDKVKKKRGLISDPSLEKEVREGLRRNFGMDAIARLNKKEIDKLLKKNNVVIDGLYSWSEYKYLKNSFGSKFKVIAIQANPSLRYERLSERREIDDKLINRPFSKKEAVQRDYDEIENIEKGGPIAMADIVIVNESSLFEFEEKLDSLFFKERTGRPNWDEYFMAMTTIASTRSSCDHFRVGAVIVLDNHIIGTGYNGAPPGVKRNCLEVGCNKEKEGSCFSDAFDIGKCIGVHAEMNALANLTREIHGGATLYVTIFPCPACAKNLLAYNFKKVVYKREYDDEESKLSKAFFKEANVEVKQLDLSSERLKDILFNKKKVEFDVF
jgi:deoxycytidylate deaminase/broad-specificity NMP kinase